MNKKKIQYILKRDIQKLVPDVWDKISSNLGFQSFTPTVRRKTNLKLVFSSLMVLFIGLFTLVLDPFNLIIPKPIPQQLAFSTKEEIYTISSLSATRFLSQWSAQLSQTLLLTSNHDSLNRVVLRNLNGSNSMIMNHIDILNQYVSMIEPIIGEKDSIALSSFASDLPQYQNLIRFHGVNLLNQFVYYKLYFNENTDVDNKVLMNGIFLIGQDQYVLQGITTSSKNESKFELVATNLTFDQVVIKMEYNKSLEEEVFEFTIEEQGDTVFESKMEVELKDNKLTAKFEHESESDKATFNISRKMVVSTNRFEIEYKIENDDYEEEGVVFVEIIYDEVNQTYQYRYQIKVDEQELYFNKNRKDYEDLDDDDEDDDDDDDEDDDEEDDDEADEADDDEADEADDDEADEEDNGEDDEEDNGEDDEEDEEDDDESEEEQVL